MHVLVSKGLSGQLAGSRLTLHSQLPILCEYNAILTSQLAILGVNWALANLSETMTVGKRFFDR